MIKRVTLITGASSGIGAATAKKLAAPGETLLLHARGGTAGEKIELLHTVAESVVKEGAEAHVYLTDLGNVGAGRDIVNWAIETCGQLDRVVSNAGFALNTRVGEVSRDELDNSYRVIMGAFFDIVDSALPYLKKSKCGRLVATSSFVASQVPGGQLFPVTAMAKGALESFAKTLAVQLAADNITVNCVVPGFTEKEKNGHSALSSESWAKAAAMTPNLRLAKPSDIAAAIAFFLSDEAGHITGQTLRVDGGLSLV